MRIHLVEEKVRLQYTNKDFDKIATGYNSHNSSLIYLIHIASYQVVETKDSINTTQTYASQRFLEVAREMVSLMHKDYGPNPKPRRKPPINNNIPLH